MNYSKLQVELDVTSNH